MDFTDAFVTADSLLKFMCAMGATCASVAAKSCVLSMVLGLEGAIKDAPLLARSTQSSLS